MRLVWWGHSVAAHRPAAASTNDCGVCVCVPERSQCFFGLGSRGYHCCLACPVSHAPLVDGTVCCFWNVCVSRTGYVLACVWLWTSAVC